MIRLLNGDLIELPGNLPRTVDCVRDWYIQHNSLGSNVWPSQVTVVGEKREERDEREESMEERNESKNTYDLFHVLFDPCKRVRIPMEWVKNDHPNMRECRNWGVLSHVLTKCVGSPQNLFSAIWSNPHPRVVEEILCRHGTSGEIIDWEHLAANPDHRIISLVKERFSHAFAGFQDADVDEDADQDADQDGEQDQDQDNNEVRRLNDIRGVHAGILRNPSPEWAEYLLTVPLSEYSIPMLAAHPDPRVIDYVWSGILNPKVNRHRASILDSLPVNDAEKSVEHILTYFDTYQLFRYSFVRNSRDERVVKRCLFTQKLFPTARFHISAFNSTDSMADYLLDPDTMHICSGDLVRNTNDRIVEWLMNEESLIKDNLNDALRNTNPRASRLVSMLLREMPPADVISLFANVQKDMAFRDFRSPVFSPIAAECLATIIEVWKASKTNTLTKLNLSCIVNTFSAYSEDEIDVQICENE